MDESFTSHVIGVTTNEKMIKHIGGLGCVMLCRILKDIDITPITLGWFSRVMSCRCCTDHRRSHIMADLDEYKEALVGIDGKDGVEVYKRFGVTYLMCPLASHGSLRSIEGYVNDIVSIDDIDHIPYTNEAIAAVLDRISYLKKNEKVMWKMAMRSAYHSYFKRMYPVCLRSNIPIELLTRCLNLYPDVVVMKKMKKDVSSDPVVQYMMGFMGSQPTEAQLKERMLLLSTEDGRSQFIEEQKAMTRSRTLDTHSERDIVNTRTSMLDDVVDYYWYDIVEYKNERGKVFYFTSLDLTSLNSTGTNYMTGVQLSLPFKHRVVKMMHDHPDTSACRPVADLVEALFNRPPIEDLVSTEPEYRRVIAREPQEEEPQTTDDIPAYIFSVVGTLYLIYNILTLPGMIIENGMRNTSVSVAINSILVCIFWLHKAYPITYQRIQGTDLFTRIKLYLGW
jgi:hypothetical protein